MPRPASASTKDAIGPLPVPTAVRSLPFRRSLHLQTLVLLGLGGRLVPDDLEGPRPQVLDGEAVPHLLGSDLAAVRLRDLLDHPRELDLQTSRQVEAVLGLHDVRDAALSGLAVDADDRLVRPPDVLRVDRQVRHLPDPVSLPLDRVHALLDRVLVRAGERRVDELADIRVADVHRQLIAVLDDAADLVDVREVELRVDAVAEQVHREGDDVDVARALAVPEQGALDALAAREEGELGRGDGAAPVVVRMDREDDRVASRDVPTEPLELVGVDVRGRHLDRRRQVQDDLPVGPRLPDVHDPLADLERVVHLRADERLRRVLEADLGLGQLVERVEAPGLRRRPRSS